VAHEAEAMAGLLARAEPVIESVVGYYRRRAMLDGDECDAVASTVRLRLLVKLRAAEEIESFDGYVARLAYNAVNDVFRQRFPARAQLKKRIVDAATRDRRFAVDAANGATICRLRAYAGALARISAADAHGIAPMLDRDAAGDAIAVLLGRAGGSAPLSDVVAALLAVWQPDDVRAPSGDVERVADPALPPPLRLELREELESLWREIQLLPPPQRAALLLNLRAGDSGNVASLLVLTGITSFPGLAAAMAIAAGELESLWNELPLDDAAIAHRLGVTRQQVINLRKAARERLRRRMQAWRSRG